MRRGSTRPTNDPIVSDGYSVPSSGYVSPLSRPIPDYVMPSPISDDLRRAAFAQRSAPTVATASSLKPLRQKIDYFEQSAASRRFERDSLEQQNRAPVERAPIYSHTDRVAARVTRNNMTVADASAIVLGRDAESTRIRDRETVSLNSVERCKREGRPDDTRGNGSSRGFVPWCQKGKR